jgi:hypothetical protein
MTSDDFESYLLVKGVNHIPVPRSEHHGIGVAEKAIQDLSNIMRSYLTDSNLPGIYWDYVVEHAALVNSMITPSITDKSRTIFEHVWGVVPNLDLMQRGRVGECRNPSIVIPSCQSVARGADRVDVCGRLKNWRALAV